VQVQVWDGLAGCLADVHAEREAIRREAGEDFLPRLGSR